MITDTLINTYMTNYQGGPSTAALTDGNEIEWMISPDLTSLPTADRLYNWAESIYSDLFPNHPTSQDVFGYYARVYENGNALGEQDDHIYFYDGNSITLVGTADDFLPDAMAAGF